MPILIAESRGRERLPIPPNSGLGWRWLGWFGFLLAAMGFGDIALAWIPPAFGNPQWEFGTIATTFAGLPLATIGLASVAASALSLGNRRLLVALVAVLLALGVAALSIWVLFLTDVPLALRAAHGPASLAIKKAIVKTVMLGLGFGALYVAGSVAGIRHLRTKRP